MGARLAFLLPAAAHAAPLRAKVEVCRTEHGYGPGIARKRSAAERRLLEALEAEREAVRIATEAGRPL
ncbi:MAG: hypothetical protein IT374_04950 [Polyangiaceae bacterium]|nr:hypothetical protein [Polyangiaceae bacterium]